MDLFKNIQNILSKLFENDTGVLSIILFSKKLETFKYCLSIKRTNLTSANIPVSIRATEINKL